METFGGMATLVIPKRGNSVIWLDSFQNSASPSNLAYRLVIEDETGFHVGVMSSEENS